MTQFVAKDITGQRFGKQVAIKFVEKRNGHHYWEILCDCGRSSIKAKIVYLGPLVVVSV